MRQSVGGFLPSPREAPTHEASPGRLVGPPKLQRRRKRGEGVKDLRVRNVCGNFGPGFNAVLDPCLANAM